MNVNDYFKYKKRVVVKIVFSAASTDWKYESDEDRKTGAGTL
jgi:hypothetical protein